MTKLYCSSLWKSIHIDVDGYLTPCCIFVHGLDKKDRIEDVSNLEDYLINNHKKYRDLMEKGEWPDGCNQCKFAEQENRKSKRIDDLNFSTNFKTDLQVPALEYLQLKTGRICNLKCTICGPACSTAIASDLLKSGEITQEYYDQLNKEIEWATNPDEYKKITSINGFSRIDIAGGEPLLNETHFDWLDSLDNKDAYILYNTNGTIRPKRNQIEIWKKFKSVKISISIDSYENKFEELRVGAKWDKVLSNYVFFEKLLRNEFNEQSTLSIVFTVHAGNVNDIFEVYNKINKVTKYEFSESIAINYLYYPEGLAIHNMPQNMLKDSIEIYEKNIKKLPESKLKNDIIKLHESMKSFYHTKKIELSKRPSGSDHRDKIINKLQEEK
jgi:radical SAM protein with 4Fe4S-binding SPASM domain